MTLQEFQQQLAKAKELRFVKESGEHIETHFHVTEVGQINKKFIDCGGVMRSEKKISLQLWSSTDTSHQLEGKKMLHIIDTAVKQLHIGNHEIEVEYQGDTIEIFGLDFNGEQFVLTSKNTACLAQKKGTTSNACC